MKKHGKASMSVMLALLAVLLVSLGYLSIQGGGREGMTGSIEETMKKTVQEMEEKKKEGMKMKKM
jgi:hypothetical protein